MSRPQAKPFRNDWADLLTEDEKELIESGQIVSTIPLIGNDPELVRRIMDLTVEEPETEPKAKTAEAKCDLIGICTECLCYDCRARVNGDCEKKCTIEECKGHRKATRCEFREKYRAPGKKR
jgi:hypothetical protein